MELQMMMGLSKLFQYALSFIFQSSVQYTELYVVY
jgi:hypothetical protein